MEDALDNEIEMDEVCHPERSAERGVEGSRAASAGESSEWAQLAACLHPGVSVRLPLSRIPSKSYAHVKRVFDITFSAGAVVILSPVLLACAVAVKATSPGPVLFRQERWGRAGERFECIKFRTMLVETPPDMPAQDFADKAAFMTPVGDFLRRWSLDELPQLANILKGARNAMLDYDAYYNAVNGKVNDMFYYYREQAALKAKQYQRALDDMAKAIELNPEDLTYRAELAVVNLRVGRYEEALNVLKAALEKDPKYAEAYRLMGIAQLQMKKDKEACASFAKAKELGDPNVDALIEKHCK